MNATPILVADAVTAEINSAVSGDAFAIDGFTARRSYADWDESFSDLNEMAVDVVFRSMQPDGSVGLACDGEVETTHDVHVAIRKRFDQSDRDSDGRLKNEAVDPLVTLLQQIHLHFVGRRNTGVLDGLPNTSWEESFVASWVNQSKLRRGLFEGYVRLRFVSTEAV